MEHSLLDIVWVIVASSLVFIMQAGFAMVESGLTRSKNSINVAIKNLTDFGVSLLVFWALGFTIMFGSSWNGLIGLPGASVDSVWRSVFLLFQAMFCSTAATIVSGAVAERMRFGAYIVSTILLAGLLYPIFGHWAWGGALEGQASGWLVSRGFVDFAGSTVVHSMGGWIALAVLLVLGPRTGRFAEDGSVRQINGSSIPQAVLGVLLLWFGWIGFNGGSTLALNEAVPKIIVHTMIAGASGMVFALALGWPLEKRPDVNLVINGALAGLVAITAPCHAVNEFQSFIIGGLGAVVMLGASRLLQILKIDDAVDAIPVHLAAGIWGTLAVGIFGDLDILGTGLDRAGQIGVQALGIFACGIFALGLALPFLLVFNKIFPLRVSKEHEQDGLNKAEHGVTTEIHDLFSVLDTQAKSGDLKLRAPVEPFTEAGQIARMYNSVMDKLQDSTVEKGEYLNILENVSDGLFLLNKNYELSPFYSAALEDIFRTTKLAGRKIGDILSGFLDEKIRSVSDEFLKVAFDASIAWRNAERLNPLKSIDAFFDDQAGGFEVRHLEFSFTRVETKFEGKTQVDRLLVVVKDLTQKMELEEQIEKARSDSRQEMEMLQRILHVDPQTLLAFLESVRQDAHAINDELKDGSPDMRQRLDTIFRLSHAIKGDAELLQLDFLVDQAEELEGKVMPLRNAPYLAPEDFLPLAVSCSGLLSTLERLDKLMGKWLNLSTAVKTQIAPAKDLLQDTLSSMCRRLADRYGKDVRLVYELEGDTLLKPQARKALKDIIVQLIRNSIYHGIEVPSLREASGKMIRGTLEVSMHKVDKTLRLRVRDDGKGLDLEAIREKALKKGLMDEARAQAMDEKEAYALIFTPGFSTAETSDSVAGKGIGMSLVRNRVKELGAQLQLKSRKGLYCEYLILIPLSQKNLLSEEEQQAYKNDLAFEAR